MTTEFEQWFDSKAIFSDEYGDFCYRDLESAFLAGMEAQKKRDVEIARQLADITLENKFAFNKIAATIEKGE